MAKAASTVVLSVLSTIYWICFAFYHSSDTLPALHTGYTLQNCVCTLQLWSTLGNLQLPPAHWTVKYIAKFKVIFDVLKINATLILSFLVRSSCLNVWIHGIDGHQHLLKDIPTDIDCSKLISLASSRLGVPSNMLILSTGVNVLKHQQQLHTYLSQVNSCHGLNLQCYIKGHGGDSGDELGKIISACW